MILTDLRKIKAVLNKMSKENNFDLNSVFINKQFKYIENAEVSYLITIYKGQKFKIKYIDGCFYPFVCYI